MKLVIKLLYFAAAIFFLVMGIVRSETSFYSAAAVFTAIGTLNFIIKKENE